MPLVTAIPKGLQNGNIITEFTDTTNLSAVTYTYPTQQTSLVIENSGEKDIFVTVGSYTDQLINADKKWKVETPFTSFSIRSDVNSQEFIATASFDREEDLASLTAQLAEKANKTYVDDEIAKKANGAPKGVFAKLADLQAAYPTGSADNMLVTGNVKEVDTLTVTAVPTASGNITVALNGVATNVAITSGVKEVASLTVSAVPTVAGNVTVTLNGVATNIALDPATDTTTDLVATKIRNAVYSTGAVTGGTASNVTFTASAVGVKTDAAYSAGTTGSTGTMSTTTQGVDADTTTSVATKIRGTTFSGWTTGGTGATVTFTKTTGGTNTAPSYSAGTTGATGTMAVTTAGVNADGNWYYWNGSVWTAGGVYQSTGLADGIISPKNTDFMKSITVNLIDINALSDGYVNTTTGEIIVAVDAKVSDFTEVEEGQTYSTNAGSKSGGYYNSNKQFVQGIAWNAAKPYVVPTGLGIKYIRASFTLANATTAMMFKGSTLYAYVPYVSDFQLDSKIKIADTNMKGNFSFPIDIKQASFYKQTKNIFDKNKIIIGSFISSSTGAIIVDTGYSASDFMVCKPSTQYCKSGTQQLAFYDTNKAFISGITYGAGSKLFTTPVNAFFIRTSLLNSADNLDQYMVYEGATLPTTYLPPYELTYDEGKKTPLLKKKWVSYGDSLTNMNVWQPIVADKLGLTSVVRGIGSTTITEIGSLAYVDATGAYVDKPIAWGGTTDTPPAGTTQILSSLSNDQRIATIPVDADIVTLLAGTNDMNMNKPIGTTIDFANVNEFKSAYAIAIKKIMQRIPKKSRLITITLPQSNKGTTVNSAGHTPKNYADAIKEVSSLYGVPCIDLFNECGWNEYNLDYYLSDGVHPYSDTGATRMAEVISKGMNGLV